MSKDVYLATAQSLQSHARSTQLFNQGACPAANGNAWFPLALRNNGYELQLHCKSGLNPWHVGHVS